MSGAQRLRLIRAALALCLAAALGAATLLTLAGLQATLPQAQEYRQGTAGEAIALRDVAEARRNLNDRLTLNAEATTLAQVRTAAGRRHEGSVDLSWTDGFYPTVHPLFLRKGTFFLPEGELTNRRVCVISTTLATELILT